MMWTGLWLLLCVSSLLMLVTTASQVSATPRGYSAARRRTSTSPSPQNEDSTSTTTPCNGVPTMQSHRRACSFYVWDGLSAIFYKWCHHLLKDHLYEGKGGHMFVRYESNSILQLLYPCSRYSPNKCLVCGGSYPDHLELWWSNHLYTPFDRHLDETYEAALTLPKTQNGKRHKSKKEEAVVTGPPTYAFHKQYVKDVSELIRGEKSARKQMELVQKEFGKEQKQKEKAALKGWRLTKFSQYKVAYVLPELKSEGQRRLSFALPFLRALALSNLDNLIVIQETENKKLKEGSSPR